MKRVFFFGYGYSTRFLAQLLRDDDWSMAGTTNSQDNVKKMWDHGVEPHVWTGEGPLEAPFRVMNHVTHILHSLRPGAKGDAVLQNHFQVLSKVAPQLKWYGYLSSVSVYGDTKGAIATEDYEPNPISPKGKVYLRVENRHRQLQKKFGLPLHIFRVAPVYGPWRGAIQRAVKGEPQIIHKEGHKTTQIHVRDLAQILKASMENPNPGAVYNCVDDLATGPEVPVEYAYELLGNPKPPVRKYESVEAELPQQTKTIYTENLSASNERVKSELGIELLFPTYKEGYTSLANARLPMTEKTQAD